MNAGNAEGTVNANTANTGGVNTTPESIIGGNASVQSAVTITVIVIHRIPITTTTLTDVLDTPGLLVPNSALGHLGTSWSTRLAGRIVNASPHTPDGLISEREAFSKRREITSVENWPKPIA